MTSENKVALVIGFALVLFVGILVSDHLSKAQARQMPTLVPAAGVRRPAAAGPARFVDLRSELPHRPPAPAPVVHQQVTAAPGPVMPQAAEPEPAPTGQAATVQPPERTYVVRPGESLSTICQQVYGTASLTGALAAHNGISDPNTLWAGRRLSMPDAAVLTGGPAAPAATGEGPALPARPETYQVRPGDSLSDIAQRFMGSAGRWRQLYELNRAVIDDPDNIRVGTELRIPG